MNNSIIASVIVDRSIAHVWWQWTTHEGLLTFFGADNRVQLEIGGHFEIYFMLDNPEGLRGSEGCKILSYLPEKMLSFSWNAPPQFPSIRNHDYKTWVVVHFTSTAPNQTSVELQHLGWPAGDQWDEVRTYFESAWPTVLDWLKKSNQQ